ncbi:unnamed protein product [Trifolium pratense]|uniref:Uncharacterized protein n=1 Tax=Trifolium pratense TaxID=57577 RepID=A0ACB0JQW8_TRIPR|nr:unnamed protein product [Trifolium pratense]
MWNETGLGAVIEGRIQTVTRVAEVLFDICKVEEAHGAGLVAVVAFMIWKNRNKWIWNGVKDQERVMASRVVHLIGDWNAVNLAHQQGATSLQESAETQWQRPELGRWKCNVDASFYEPAGHTG